MIIVIEGAENSGKSTLAKKLSEALGLEVVHPGGAPKNIAEAIYRCSEQHVASLSGSFVSFIYDRVTCISDKIYRGKPQYHSIFNEYLTFMMDDEQNVIFIFCRASDERMKCFDDHEMKEHDTVEAIEYAKDNISRIIKEYDDLIAEHVDKPNVCRYDFEADPNGVAFEELVRILKEKMNESAA